MNRDRKIVTVFGSSRPAAGDPEYAQARSLGKALAAAGFTVCNGGFGGTMEASARGAHEAGGKTIGVVTPVFGKRSANRWIDEVVEEESLIARMTKLIELGDAYVVLKGGTGTLLELAAVWEYMNKGLMQEKPTYLLGSFWNGVVGTLKKELSREGRGDCTRYVMSAATPEECARMLAERLR